MLKKNLIFLTSFFALILIVTSLYAANVVLSAADHVVISEIQVAGASSTEDDEVLGNGEDTDDNATDFVTRTTPEPQNSSSAIENPGEGPTPTVEPTVVPTETPTPTTEPTPTVDPTPTEEPTEEPSTTPTVEPTPTDVPTPTPTVEPRSIFIGGFPLSNRECRLSFRIVRIGFFRFAVPKLTCN